MPLPSSDRPLPPSRAPSHLEFPPTGRVTLILIVACVAVSLWSSLGEDTDKLLPLFISLSPFSSPEALSEVRGGEIWRLFPPAFIHFGVAHLLFNMLGMQMLGSAVEARNGRRFYLVLVGVLALTTNLAQYMAVGPFFGGMSGVLYGLFGYIWLRSVCDPASGFYMPRETIIIALVWFLACFTRILGPIANIAHTAGLVLGAIWGAVAGRLAVWRDRGGDRRRW
jgi:GlpG protein